MKKKTKNPVFKKISICVLELSIWVNKALVNSFVGKNYCRSIEEEKEKLVGIEKGAKSEGVVKSAC